MMPLIALSAMFACATPEPAPDHDVSDELVELDAPRLLRRMSLDIRGVLPTPSELDAVGNNPDQLGMLRDEYFEDPRFEDRFTSILGERWLTLLDDFEVDYYDYGLPPEQEFAYERSIGEEPLRLMARIAALDHPWTETVTADYTVANELLASVWPLSYPAGATGWQVATYQDGRPGVGVLSTNGFWWRYVTNNSNMNRGRAAAVMRLFLCQDILSRPVSLASQISLEADDGIAEAIRANPSCVTCHATLDPLASSLFGWWTVISYNADELSTYHAERERLGPKLIGSQPSYFGKPLDGFVDLGSAIANDSRFYTCSARSAAEMFWRRPTEEGDFERIEQLRVAFISGGLRYRDLIAEVMDTPEYQVGGFTDNASEATVARERTLRLATPDLIHSMVEDLTGYSWQYEGFDQLRNDNPGYRTLAGGVDGYSVTRAQQDPGITWTLVTKNLADGAASTVVDQELSGSRPRKLFTEITLADRPGDAPFDREIEALHWRLFAVAPDAERIASAEDFWSTIDAEEGPAEAWTRLVSAMLRDPEFVAY